MARYSHLPIFIKTYESVKLVYKIVRQFNDSPELPAFLGRDEWRVSERGRGNCSFLVEESSERVCERALRTEGS